MTTTTATLVETLAAKVDQATARMERAQQSIADQATSGSASALNDLVLDLARREGEVTAWSRLHKAAQHHGADLPALYVIMMETLAYGPDDQASGRGNEVRRARFDGIREVAEILRWM